MIIRQYEKPFVPKYANYDYVPVYDGNDRFIGWIKMLVSELEPYKEYKDLEEQGLLLRLPTETYFIKDNIVRKGWVQELVYSPCRKLLLDIRYDDNSLDSYRGYVDNTLFLTQAEAEQKLKETESDWYDDWWSKKSKKVAENTDCIVQLIDKVAKVMVEAFKNLKIEDINMFQLGYSYNKALDDFVNACEKHSTTMYGQRYIDTRDIKNIAELLKEQNKWQMKTIQT